MTDSAQPKTPDPQLAMVVLVPEADDPDPAQQRAPVSPLFGAILTDPFQLLAASGTAWVDLRFSPEGETIRLDLPYKDPDELYELLETLYVLHGWKGVDAVLESVERALLARVIFLHPLPAAAMAPVRSGASGAAHYARVPFDPPAALARLTALAQASGTKPGVVLALKAVIPSPDLFSADLPHADTSGVAWSDTEIGVRLFANVLLALQGTRSELVGRVRQVLFRIERELLRLISATLTHASAEIRRETARYFTLGEESAEIALERLKDLNVSNDGKPAQGGKIPLAKNPRELQQALKDLLPFANEVTRLDASPRGAPSTERMIESKLRVARAIFAREVGRRAQAFPILSQVDAGQVRKASAAGAAGLGDVLFPILTRAHEANKSMRGRLRALGGMRDVLPGERYPELALAGVVGKAGAGKSLWAFRKYTERATARIVGEGDDVARRASSAVALAMTNREEEANTEAIGKSAGEMLVLGAATHFASKLVPVLNVAAAAWHIAEGVKEFGDRHDEFYCALDPRDSLVESAPSAASLALHIATEAVFALV